MNGVQKLINEYEQKVQNCESEFKFLLQELAQLRKDGTDESKVQFNTYQRKLVDTRRQIYYQFTKDLEDLL